MRTRRVDFHIEASMPSFSNRLRLEAELLFESAEEACGVPCANLQLLRVRREIAVPASLGSGRAMCQRLDSVLPSVPRARHGFVAIPSDGCEAATSVASGAGRWYVEQLRMLAQARGTHKEEAITVHTCVLPDDGHAEAMVATLVEPSRVAHDETCIQGLGMLELLGSSNTRQQCAGARQMRQGGSAQQKVATLVCGRRLGHGVEGALSDLGPAIDRASIRFMSWPPVLRNLRQGPHCCLLQ
mmetsp:Transcript_9382/g.21158  ORF Transcript_9382/g.21158 Transcript_9382/m.21158 type:complete len:242 (+) Transcript_9382:1025-1750(+)